MANHESSLPSEIVEHIQSFMNGKDGARTTILSKSLCNAWSKRPNLDFDQRHFGYRHSFPEFTKKTMQRYEDSNLKIHSFTLRISSDNLSLVNELILWAMKLGAVDIKLEFLYGAARLFVLPDEILESETLARLSITGGAIALRRNREVTRSKLKSIQLSRVIINGDLFSHLLLRCPSIEKLVCDGQLLSFDNKLGSVFHKLESLSLDILRNRDTSFFQDMLLKFPCLKTLVIRNVHNCSNIRICSRSLERISIIEYYRAVAAEFDVPNLRKFHFEGSALSRLTFETKCRDWDSDIHIICFQSSASWLSSFRKLLQQLSMSKISLSVYVKYPSNYVCDYSRDEAEPIPTVDHLKIMDHAPPNPGLLDGLFLICRPKLVYQQCLALGNWDLLELLWKKLGNETSENQCICIPNPSTVLGLEEVNVEVFEKRVSVWRPLPWKALLDATAFPQNAAEFRFRLRWRSEASAL